MTPTPNQLPSLRIENAALHKVNNEYGNFSVYNKYDAIKEIAKILDELEERVARLEGLNSPAKCTCGLGGDKSCFHCR